MVRYHSMLSTPRCCTFSASVAIKLPITTREEVKTMPAFRDQPSVTNPNRMIPRIWPTMREFEILVWSAAVYAEPYMCLKITFTLLAIFC